MKNWTAYLALTVLFVPNCSAFETTVTFQQVYGATIGGIYFGGAYTGGLEHSRPVFGDIDGDGDLDIFTDRTFWENIGTTHTPSWAARIRNYLPGPADQLADIDGDSDLDLFVRENDGSITLYENTGTSRTPTWAEPVGNYGSLIGPGPVRLADLDGDGDLDLFNGRNYCENTGTRTLPVWSTPVANFIPIAGVFADIDGDGDLDLFGNRTVWRSGIVVFCKNLGTRQSAIWAEPLDDYCSLRSPPPCTPSLADIDSDADYDIFLSSHEYYYYGEEPGVISITFYENTGTSYTASWSEPIWPFLEPFDMGGCPSPAFWDIDADGDYDLFFGSDADGLWLYHGTRREQSHNWLWPVLVPLSAGGGDVYSFNLADIDADADGDLFIVTHYEGSLYFYKNEGTDTSPTWIIKSYSYAGVNHATSAAFADIDNDGDLDLFASMGQLYYYENYGSPKKALWDYPEVYYEGVLQVNHIAFGDVDVDGDLDLLTDSLDGIIVYENVGTAKSAQWAAPVLLSSISSGIPALFDVDDDGDLDLFTGGTGLYAYENMTLNLRVSPRRTQVELYKGQQFCVSGTTATVVWYFVANRSGGTIDPATGFYTAGPVNNVEDVIEARDPVTGDRGRAWVKVIPPPYVRNEKIIICAGGGNYPGNSILSQTNYLANYAYRMSLKRGYRKQDIYYLNADGSRIHDADGDGLNDANATATLVNLQWAISTWASDARRLFIYMVDHGTPTQFRVNPAEFLSAATFDAWLDTLQVTYGTTVIVVLDYCYSGSFLASCTAPPGRRRTVIASAGSNELATFLAPYGYISFSNFFLGYAHMGANLFDSFAWTRDALNFTYAGQIPRIDDNGDGLSNKNDGYYARTQYWGFDYGFGATPPEIVEVTPDRILNGENSTLLYCRVVPTLPVSRVWAVIQPPGGLAYSGGEPITDMPQVELFTTDGTYYSAVCTQFGRLGSYTLIYYAIDIEGRVSWPRKSRIMQLSAPDSYEVDDEARLASEYIFSNVAEFPPEQRHNFHDAGDTDWIRFWALGGRSYTMYIENCGSMCDAVLELYNGSLTLLTSVDWNGAGLGEMLTWNFPTTGTYYWKVYNYQPAVHGEGTSYTARLADNSGAGLGIATALGSNKLRMEWTSGLGPTDQGFNVYRYNSTTGNWVKINTMPVTSNSYVDGNLMPSRTYYYLIRLLRADGSEPAWTGYFSGTTSDSVCFASAGQTVSENCGTVWIGVQLSKSPASPVTVTYGVGGTATAGTDYVMPSGTLVFAAGQQSKYLELTINDDGRDEPDETIILVLTGRTNGDVGEPTTYTLTIQDNDESPGVQSVSLLDGTPTNAPSVRFRVVFSKAVSGVDAGDFSTSPTGLTGTAISNVAGVDQIWTVTVGTGAGSGRLSLVVEDNDTIVDGAGNPLGGAGAGNGRYTAGPAYDIDRVAPTVAIASSAEDPTSEWPIPVTVTFSEPVIGFEASDVTCSSCTVTNFTGEGANYSFGLVPWYQGEVTAQVCAGVASDAVGNGNMQSAVLMRTFESPTRVEGCTYAAKRKGSLVWIEWQTARELGNLGFHVYREAEGHLERLTSELVAGSALLAGAGVHLPAGQSYGWWDMAAPDGARYWIEDWDIGGGQTLHGPVVPVDAEVLPADTQSALLAQLNRQDDAERIRAVRAALQKTAVMRDTARPSTAPLSSPRPLASFTQLFHPTNPANAPSPLDRQWALAAGPAVKIVVAREGVQRISRAELVTAGLDPACNPRDLQLYYRGCEIPITVVMSGEGRRASWDAIEFYAEGQDTLWTDARTYWLVVGTKPGLRLKTAAGGGQNWPSPAAFLETIERKDRTIYFAALRNGAEENFFGPIITGEGVEQVLSLPYPILEPAGTHLLSRTSPSTATLEVWLQGVTAGAHRVAIYLNDIKVGVAEFEGLERGAAQFTVSHSLLRAGDNLIGLRALGGASDVSLVDRIRLCYWRTYAAHKNRLHCTAPGGTRVLIGGFSSPAITVLDITDPLSPHRLEGEVARNRSGYAITVAVQGKGERVLHAYGQGATERPAAVAANCPSQWNAAGRAYDMAIIAHETLTSTVAPLAALRASQGYRVAVVAVEDLYDEFNFGEKSALALRDFLRRTVTAWHQPPKYVLLVGDASFDPRNYLGFGNSDLVPTKLVDTELIETACDDWFADLNEDGLAEMAVGRLPVRNAAEAAALVSKIIGYESAWSSLFGGLVRSSHRRDLASIPSPNIETIRTSPAEAGTTYPYPADLATPHWAKTILLVADNNDLFNFERASAEIGALAPAEFTVERVCLGTSDLPTARAMLLECLTSGALMVNYIGHGSFETWAAERLFTAHDAESLTNAPRLPFVISMTCLNGFTHNPRADSLAEGLLKNPRGGAVAVWASSGLTEPIQQSVMNKELIRRLFGSRAPTLGEAITAAKAAIGNPDIRRTWVLLGDPSMRVK